MSRRKKTPAINAKEPVDTGTPELHERQKVGKDKHGRNRVESRHPLDIYRKCKNPITRDQHRAGMRLFRDYESSHVTINIFSVLGLTRQKGTWKTSDSSEGKMSAYDRFMSATMAMNFISRKLLLLVCVHGHMLPEVRQIMRFTAKNSGLDRLKEALDELAAYYEEPGSHKKSIVETAVTKYNSQYDGRNDPAE